MKVELEKLRLAVTGVTESIVVGIPAKDGKNMLDQKDVTNDFVAAVILWCGTNGRIITASSGEQWDISVKKIK